MKLYELGYPRLLIRKGLRRLGLEKTPCVLTVDRIEMLLHPIESDNAISPMLLRSRMWEPVETALFKKLLKPGMTVVDIGANIGYHSLLAAKLVKPKGKVYAFEPAPDNYELLVKNIKLNGFGAYIIPVNKAVDASPGKLKLFLSPKNKGDHRTFGKPVFDYDVDRQAVDVESISLDAFFLQEPRTPDVIKLDIQGYEFNVLKGMPLLLKRCPTLLLFTEVWPRGLLEAGASTECYVDTLLASGFKLYLLEETGAMPQAVSRAEVLELASKCDDSMYLNLLCQKGAGAAFGANSDFSFRNSTP